MSRPIISLLPPHLAERAWRHPDGSEDGLGDGEFILYWARVAVRGHENPALDAAIELGRAAGRPVFVYHAVSEHYAYAADRHHRFILEGARDFAAELAQRGIGYALHVERPGHRQPALRSLASRAAATVTEDMPVRQISTWTQRLAERAKEDGGGPLLVVDTACVVPMRSAGEHCHRAFAFRDATRGARELALATPWRDAEADASEFRPELPFEPVDPATADLDALIASCQIDHTIPAVASTPGGSVAGYARWNAFRAQGLRSYHRNRNDPLRDGTSRMSAYLHYGQVSPFRLAREALADGSAGAEKFLDELMVWRELAYAFCARYPDHDALGALPAWAQRTLREHAGDPRENLDWETLARGQTGDRLWDAAQRSLLIHGELHNNVRMTWGKAFLRWSATPERALAMASDLNDRYALDGRDPASFGGILWCFGAFDRPFEPPQPIYGTVRGRSTEAHGKRLDVPAYTAKILRPSIPRPPRVAVIGAGVAGLTCARTCADQGLDVFVVEQAETSAGRISTRHEDGLAVDLGASFLTATDPRFRRALDAWVDRGVAAPWPGRFLTLGESAAAERRADGAGAAGDGRVRFVGTPGMSAILHHLTSALTDRIHTATRVTEVRPLRSGWQLETTDLAGRPGATLECDFVVFATTAPQTASLAETISPRLASPAAEVPFEPCWSVYLHFAAQPDWPFDGVRFLSGAVESAWRETSKPDRGPAECWVLHGSPAFSEANLQSDPETVIAALREAVTAQLRIPAPELLSAEAQLWNLARPRPGLQPRDCLVDAAAGVGACGDWCVDGTVEGAYLSGAALAGRIMAWANRRPVPSQGELFVH